MHIECIQLLENAHEISGSMPVIFKNTHGTIKWYMQARQFVTHKLACMFDILIVYSTMIVGIVHVCN